MSHPTVQRPATSGPRCLKAFGWGGAALLLVVGGAWYFGSPSVRASAAVSAPAGVIRAVPLLANGHPMDVGLAGGPQAERPTSADSFLTEYLQQTFEDMMLEATAAGDVQDVAVLRQRLNALVGKYFPPELVQRATALLWRYVDYRQALGQLAAPTSPGDPAAMRTALQARQRVRQQYFSPEEYAALFGQEERLDRFTMARLAIEQQTTLSAEQKQAALAGASQELSEGQRAQRAAAVQHLDVQAQTASFESRNAGAAERYAERSAQFGSEAANRLSELDGQERQWQNNLTQYAQASAALPANASTAQTQQLEQLRQKLFTPEQQLRVDAGLALRALAQQTPKN